jgi:hypothetical protein
MPAWQVAAVITYLSSGIPLPNKTLGWNPKNRGYPDVAAIGENFCVVDPGTYVIYKEI